MTKTSREMIGLLRTMLVPFLFVGASMLASCGGGNPQSEDDAMGMSDEDQEGKKTMDKTTRKIFYAIPSPLEMAILIKQAGASYDKDLLNPIENADQYETSYKQAMNLGIYGADLSYTSMFDQAQESLFYLSCARKLSDGLGIAGAFDDATMDRLDMNKDNKDSVMEIISDAYWTSDSYLKENERYNTSALVITGGWVEGLYLAAKLATKLKNNEPIRDRIADQKSSLQNLIGLLEENKADEQVMNILTQLKELEEVFANMETEDQGEVTATTDTEGGVTTIGGGSVLKLTDAQVNLIHEKISAIRNGIISVN